MDTLRQNLIDLEIMHSDVDSMNFCIYVTRPRFTNEPRLLKRSTDFPWRSCWIYLIIVCTYFSDCGVIA